MTPFQNTTALNKTVSIFLSLTFLFWFLGFAESRRDGGEKFQCFKCEEDSEKPSKSVCTEVQTCFGRRPICAKLEFGAFFHGVMGTRTLKFCYDLSLSKAALPLDQIDLCDVAHLDFHDFSLETRSILATVCANKHSTWHKSHSCVTNLCNGAEKLTRHLGLPLLFIWTLIAAVITRL